MVTLNQNARIVSPPQVFCNATMATQACMTANFLSTQQLLSIQQLFGGAFSRQVRHSFPNVTQLIWHHEKLINN